MKFYGVPEHKEQRKGNAAKYKIEGIFFMLSLLLMVTLPETEPEKLSCPHCRNERFEKGVLSLWAVHRCLSCRHCSQLPAA